MEESLLPPKNKSLLNRKVSLLENTQFHSRGCLRFSFHGVSITFHTQSRELLSELENYIPDSWRISSSQCYEVFHHPIPEQFKPIFDDETSSIVESLKFKGEQISVQRDFIAKLKNYKKCYTIFHDKLDDGFHNFFRWYLSPKLIDLKKAMIHSSVVLNKFGKAEVFLGPSGAGKTTITSLSKPRKVLSDDMNLLQIENGKLYALAGGVGGLYKPDVDFDQKFEVENIFWLVQDSKTQIQELPPIVQSRHLLSSLANLPWNSISSEENYQILDLCKNILGFKPLKALHFTKASDFWRFLE